MCSHYQALKDRERYRRHFGTEPPVELGKADLWPQSMGSLIRRTAPAPAGAPARPPLEALPAMFGLVPHWAEDTSMARHTYNARAETVAVKPSYREAWRQARHCIVPAEAFFEPDWRSGRPVPTRIARADGLPMGFAGLWEWWRTPEGKTLHSYTMLTLAAEDHALMRLFYKPTDEKRMAVILPDEVYAAWLDANVDESAAFLRLYPAEALVANPVI